MNWKKLTSLGAGAALALGAVLVGAPAASAAGSLPDPALDGQASLVIHKSSGTSGAEGNGLEQTVSNPPLPNVGFTLQRVKDIDLLTQAGWETAAATTLPIPAANLETPITAPLTGSDGKAVVTDLDYGLYLVSETTTPNGVVPAKPFLVTLPMTHPTQLNAWLTTVHVYPKNDVIGITKDATDASAYGLGDTVSWTVAADVPTEAAITRFTITDELDSRLAFVTGSATVSVSDGTVLVPADYTVTPPATETGGTLTLDFTATGRAKLDAVAAGTTVVFSFGTTVEGVGEIPNTAVLFVNDDTVGVESDEEETRWGGLEINKHAVGDTTVGLPGAEFSVYRTEAEANSQTNPISIDGETTFVSDEDGLVQIVGLRYSNFENGAVDATPRTYWLVETKAPDGYELLTAPISFQVTDWTVVSGAQLGVAELDVANVPHNAGFDLPSVGGQKWILPGLLGLVAAGALTLLVVRRSRSDA